MCSKHALRITHGLVKQECGSEGKFHRMSPNDLSRLRSPEKLLALRTDCRSCHHPHIDVIILLVLAGWWYREMYQGGRIDRDYVVSFHRWQFYVTIRKKKMAEVPLPPKLHSFSIIIIRSLALCHLASTKTSNAQQMCGCTVNKPGLEIRDLEPRHFWRLCFHL